MEKKPCEDCTKTDMNQIKWGIALFGFYIMGSSIYGTVELIKYIINLF